MVLLGAVVGSALVGLAWRQEDPAAEAEERPTPASLGEKPRRAVTLLLIGSDTDSIAAATNKAAPAGQANADAVVMVRVNPGGPLQILNLPVNLAVRMPGEDRPQRLGDLYTKGGVALMADTVRELLGMEAPQPDRYIVLSRAGLRRLVDGLGGLEVNPPRSMRYEDKSQKLKIDLQSGLQRLDGTEVEHMARYRDKWLGESGRRANQDLLITSLRERMAQPEQLSQLPDLLGGMRQEVQTNLSLREALSLLAASLEESQEIRFASLPLSPIKKSHEGLRQLDPKAGPRLWEPPPKRKDE